MSNITELRAYQKSLFDIAMQTRRHCLFADPGLGKTLTVCSIVDEIMRRSIGAGAVPRTLVIAPKSVMNTAWFNQWRDHGFRDAWGFDVDVLWKQTGSATRKAIQGNWAVGCINIESFRINAEHFRGVNTLVIDESTKIKTEDAKATQAVKAFAQKCANVFLLSGEPCPNNESELYSQITTVAPHAFDPHYSYWRFFNHYFYQATAEVRRGHRTIRVPVGQPRLIEAKAEDFWRRVKKHATFLSAKDVLDLPENIPLVREIELSDEELEVYTKVFLGIKAEIGDTVIDVAKGNRVMKLRQITSGFTYEHDEDGGRCGRVIGSTKMAELIDMLKGELAKKSVIVWGSFQAEIERIAACLKENGITCDFVHGGVAQAKREHHIQAFKDGGIRVLVAHPATIGHGTDGLQKVCNNAIFFSIDYSYDTHNQSLKRIAGARAKTTTFSHYLVVKNSVDAAILRTLLNKGTRAEAARETMKMEPGRTCSTSTTLTGEKKHVESATPL